MGSRLAAVLLLATTVRAADTGRTALEFARVPLSVRQQVAGAYGSYDVFKVTANPALLAWQPRTWEAGASNQLLFGGDEMLWGAGAGWAGQPGESGSFGAAVVASGLTSPAVEELDIFGEATGASIEASSLRIGAVLAYQWQTLGLGVGIGRASESYSGIDGITGPSSLLIDAGAAVRLGALELGAAYLNRGGDAPSAVTAGGAVKIRGFASGAIGGEINLPLGGDAKPFAAGGVTWNAHRMLDVRLGAFLPTGAAGAGGLSGRIGVAMYWREFALDYALGLPLGTGPGFTHLIGLGWSGGALREVKSTKAPTFALAAKDRTMAVSNFDPQGVSATDAAVVSDLLRSALVKESSFNIVEKANMDKVLQEQAFQQTGCTTQECAVKLGKVLNVKYLVVGAFSKTMGEFLISMRVVEVETSRIVYTDEMQGTDLKEIRTGITQMAGRLAQAVDKAR